MTPDEVLIVQAASDRDIMPIEQATEFVSRCDARFRTWTGAVDLIAMSRSLSEQQFRAYFDCCRLLRAAKRAA